MVYVSTRSLKLCFWFLRKVRPTKKVSDLDVMDRLGTFNFVEKITRVPNSKMTRVSKK